MVIQSDTGLNQAREMLKKGDFENAKKLLTDALSGDLENQEIISSIRCTTYWCDKLDSIMALQAPFERGETLIETWKSFTDYIGDSASDKTMYAIKCGIFLMALDNYRRLFHESNKAQKAEILRKTGLCHKKLGDYETALKFLNDANVQMPESAPVLAEMADCYALCGEERIAKVLFREAFYIDAQKIDMEFLESELITRLIKQVSESGYSGAVLKEWIPVYGVLYGVFNVKRELRALEVGKLKQNIFSLENNLKEASSEPELLVPKLINNYFRLIDYYLNVNDDRARIHEILLKIKLLDSSVHDRYVV